MKECLEDRGADLGKYIFLVGKIIRTARSVIMKLSEKYPYQEVYGNCLS
jgi:hypothetical protein